MKNKIRSSHHEKHFKYLEHVGTFSAGILHKQAISSYYGQQLSSLGKKLVHRLGPKVKRKFCPKCHAALSIGKKSYTQTLKKENSKFISITLTCLNCLKNRRFIVDPTHKTWHKNPAFIQKSVQMLKNLVEFEDNVKKMH